jgi:hypothetical protein
MLLAAATLLASCASKPDKPKPVAAAKFHKNKVAKLPRQFREYMMPTEPLPATGLRSIDAVLANYGDYAVSQLRPYFDRAGVAYPPRDITLIGLKEERKLEVWARDDGGKFRFIRDYDIKAASGIRGPKLRQGDRQVPEGIYRILHLNPNSNYHLSMKINYPNEADRYHAEIEGRTKPGNDIFIHGKAVSIGCLAMGDEAIEELFVLVAHTGTENVKVVIAPHDPRTTPLEADGANMPIWTEELYRELTDEILAITDAEPPVQVSSARPIPRAGRAIR